MSKENDVDRSGGTVGYLKVGDRVAATVKITRNDGTSVMPNGSTGIITHVWNSDNSQIVSVRPDDTEQLPMFDIVCRFDRPPVFRVIG